MKTLYIIRHGQSVANIGAESMPDKTVPLTELGYEQARELLKRWKQATSEGALPTPSAIYHSELLRARQTAQVFGAGFGQSVAVERLLNELSCLGFSTVEGMTGKERAPIAKHYWQTADIHYRDADDADTFAEFIDRVDRFIERAADFEHNSVLFGHGIWIGLLAYRLLGCQITSNADIQTFRQFQNAMPMYNTVAYRLDISDEGVMQLRVVNI